MGWLTDVHMSVALGASDSRRYLGTFLHCRSHASVKLV
jgi:hypothetical protein